MTDFFSKIGPTVRDSIYQIHALMPDSILFGSILLYFLTQNIAYGVFSIFIFETVLSHKFINYIIQGTTGEKTVNPTEENVKCRIGYKIPNLDFNKIFSHDPYPSYAIFSITSIGTYLGLATNYYSETLKKMGQEWESRIMVSYCLITIVIALFLFIRIGLCSDSINEVVMSFIAAILLGSIFFYLNKLIFGDESVNFLGLPYIVSKESLGSPIYICSSNG